jgi:hypothetical protein
MPRPARRPSSGPPPDPRRIPAGLAELVLSAAGEIGRVPTALDAELLLSTLIGGGYAAIDPDRGPALDELAAALAEHVAGVDTEPARVVGAVLAGAGLPAGTGLPAPEWTSALGTVRPTGGYAYGDRYGDQTGYVATFGYADEALGGPEHAVVFLVDHTLGLVKDIVVIAPAAAVLDQIRADEDEMTWSAPLELGAVGAAAHAYLRATDLADELPGSDSLAANRYLAGRRLALLPAAEPASAPEPSPAADELVAQFLESPEARLSGLARATGARREAVSFGLGLCVDFAGARGGDPLRWSPRAVEAFLLDWVHQRAVLDGEDAATLPDVVGAWVSWAGRRIGLPEAAVAATLDRVDKLRAEFGRLCSTGERQSPAVRATARLVAEGVDLADPVAVEEWLATYNASQ